MMKHVDINGYAHNVDSHKDNDDYVHNKGCWGLTVDEKSDFLLRTYLSLIQLKGINDDLFC